MVGAVLRTELLELWGAVIVQRICIIHEECQTGLTLVDRLVAIRVIEELTPVMTDGADEVLEHVSHKYFNEVVFVKSSSKAIGFVVEGFSISDGGLSRQHTKSA